MSTLNSKSITVTALGALVALASTSVVAAAPAGQADAAAGRTLHMSQCAKCHEVVDYQGEKPEALVASIKEVMAGKIKHKTKVKLTDAEVANLAAYWSAGK